MIYIYRLCYALAKFFVFICYPILSLKTKNYVKLRSSNKAMACQDKNVIWFHASSGEIEYCKSIITEIRQKHPKEKLVISYSSPSAEKLLFNIQKDVDFIFPIPWDSASLMKKTVLHLQPKALVFSRTDFWPELIHQANQQSIPLMAIAMFPQMNFISKFIYRWLLTPFCYLSTVTETTQAELQKTLNAPVALTSDTRFDQVFNRLNSPSRITFQNSKKKIVFASTWPEDEALLFPEIDQILSADYQLIICPHEVARATDLKNKLARFQPLLLSELNTSSEIPINVETDFKVIIMDRVGFLADVYRSTDLAFVGGSFKKKIHSVMEPLCCNNLVFFGPHYRNNPEAIAAVNKNLATVTASPNDIQIFLNTYLNKPNENLKNQVKYFAQSQRGATTQITQEILTRLKPFTENTNL